MRDVVLHEQAVIQNFFGSDNFEVPGLPGYVNNELLKHWQSLKFDLHFLPDVELGAQASYPGWSQRPDKTFYQKIKAGKISPAAIKMLGQWVLIDARDKPRQRVRWVTSRGNWFWQLLGLDRKQSCMKWSKQQFKSDYLLPELERHGFGSRFCLSIDDIEQLKPAISKLLRLEGQIVRLPRLIEYNYLGNAFYPQWSQTSTWEWFADRYADTQSLAGASKSLGIVGWEPPEFWSTILTFRPLVELE